MEFEIVGFTTILNHDTIKLLVAGTRTFGISLSSIQIQVLDAYLSHLVTWNERLNLTSIRDPELMVRRHLIDCISVVQFLRPTGHLMDVGSGAGLPGIPIAVLLQEKRVTLLEPRRRRANFLRHLIRMLELKRVRVLEKRLEELNAQQLDRLDETIARSFIDNEGLLRASAKLLPRGGTCLLMHGPKGLAFLESTRSSLEALHLRALPPKMYRLPFGEEERTVLFFVKS